MKKALVLVIGFILILISLEPLYAQGRVYVKGYFRGDGTYVQPHYRTAPDRNFYNNWSTYGNVNPYTGELGTKKHPYNRSYSTYRSNYRDFKLAPTPEIHTSNSYSNNTSYSTSNSNQVKLRFDPSIEAVSIPQKTKKSIFELAEIKWPNDYRMQTYTIEKNIEGYKELHSISRTAKRIGIKDSLITWMFNEAEKKWPQDYSMQAYMVENNLDGYLKASALLSSEEWENLPDNVSESILSTTFKKWGTDLSMIAYRLENEIDGFYRLLEVVEKMSSLQKEQKDQILSIARNKWPQDLSMQAYTVENEFEALIKLLRLKKDY